MGLEAWRKGWTPRSSSSSSIGRELTRRVFEAVAAARPRKLLIVADGPREDQPKEREACAATRKVVEKVDWECEVLRNYASRNLGCGLRPATGITWAFEHVEEAIILEDDCVPHPSFFRFATELLQRYRGDERIMVVSGSNLLLGNREFPYSYFFSRNLRCGGWATWRRAWKHLDHSLSLWPELRDTPWLEDILGHPPAVDYWRRIFDRAHAEGERASYWDLHWTFCVWAQHGLGAVPRMNLVSNNGFAEDGTHTRAEGHPLAALPTEEIRFPLRHPPWVARDAVADRVLFDQAFAGLSPGQGKASLSRRVWRTVGRRLPAGVRSSVRSALARRGGT